MVKLVVSLLLVVMLILVLLLLVVEEVGNGLYLLNFNMDGV